MFCKMDEELILTCQSKLEEDSKSSMAAEKRRLTWKQLETAASFQPVGGGGGKYFISSKSNHMLCYLLMIALR